MALNRWRKISEETRIANPWWKYKFDVFELPSHKRGEYHYVHTNGSAMVIPLHDDRTITLVKQYRYLNERESIEFVCGGVREGISYEEMARNELAEEAGLRAERILCIGEFNPFNGVTNEISKVFVAADFTQVDPHPDETEEFEILRLTFDEIDEKIRRGEIWDGMTLAGWMLFKNRALPTDLSDDT